MEDKPKVVLVTGGASGMGAATAREFAAEGAAVVIVDRNREGAAKVAAEIGAPDPLIGDVGDSTFCDHAVAQTIERCGRLDVLVNCAGIIVRADALGTSDHDWRRIMGSNVDGVFFMSRAAIPHM